MKRLIYNLFISLLAVNLVFTSCSPDNHELASVDLTSDDLVEGLAYTITADANNPNIIYLESKLDNSYTPLWEHPMGRSQEKKVTLNMAFEGTYSVRFGAMTRAGVVYGEPSTFEIAQFNASFVSGDMWEYLAGGAGNSKTWIPDDGTYNMKQGFYSCFDPTATPADMTCDEGKNNWYPVDKTWWEPSNADIGITEDDLKSYMVFSLQGKAGLTLHRFTNNQEVVTEGLFSMNTDEKKMSAIDVEFLHGEWANGKSVDFKTDFMILVLTENQMMIANFRDEALSGEGRCVYCWNFVSKDYADNYVPPTEEPTPDLPDGWLNDVTQIVNTTLKFKLSETTPYNWFNLDGSVKNNFTSLSDYPASLAPISSALGIDLVLRSATNEYSISAANGESIDGNYEITSDGFYFFNNGLPDYAIGNNDIYFRANNDNSLRLLNYTVSAGAVTDIWLGLPLYDITGKLYQYLGYHFEIQTDAGAEKTYIGKLNYFNTGWSFQESNEVSITKEGKYSFIIEGSDLDPYGIFLDINDILGDHPNADLAITEIKVDGNDIPFDDTIIDRGTGDDANTARRYILNPWAEVLFAEKAFAFESSIKISIMLSFNDDMELAE